jgi:hypothetical protein
MELIMKVEDSFHAEGRRVVVSGSNERLDSLGREEIASLIGSQVCIRCRGEDCLLDVLDIAFSESLAGKRNISILLECPPETTLARGDDVFATRKVNP